MPTDVVVCAATPAEQALLLAELGGERGAVGGRRVALLRTGVGPVNAAVALTRFLGKEEAGAVVCCGVGGAYPGSGLRPGDVVCAASEYYADLGAESPDGFLDMETLGFPVVEGDPPLFNRLPLDLFPAPRRAAFVTLATCTGTEESARAVAGRTGGAVESMEGAAVVHAARLHGVPVGEVRGISNPVGERDRKRWRVREAAEAAQRTLLDWLRAC